MILTFYYSLFKKKFLYNIKDDSKVYIIKDDKIYIIYINL